MSPSRLASFLLLWCLAALGCGPNTTWSPAEAPLVPPPPVEGEAAPPDAFDEANDRPAELARTDATLEALAREARALAPLLESAWVKGLVGAVAALPAAPARTIYHDAAKSRYLTAAQWQSLPESERSTLTAQPVDTKLYYLTKYGSPLAYARPLDLAAAAGLGHPKGSSVVDFGYGTIGHLRLLSVLGADVVAVDVDPFLAAIYHGDEGEFPKGKSGAGRIRLLHGRWPADAPIATALGSGHRLFIAKNVLKNGYIHPEKKVPDKQTVKLGVSDDEFVAALARAVEPGGMVMIYNLSPAPNGPGREYRTWADGRCPFPEALWKKHGFEVRAFDRDDSQTARRMGVLLGWASDEELEKDLFAMYSIFRRGP